MKCRATVKGAGFFSLSRAVRAVNLEKPPLPRHCRKGNWVFFWISPRVDAASVCAGPREYVWREALVIEHLASDPAFFLYRWKLLTFFSNDGTRRQSEILDKSLLAFFLKSIVFSSGLSELFLESIRLFSKIFLRQNTIGTKLD